MNEYLWVVILTRKERMNSPFSGRKSKRAALTLLLQQSLDPFGCFWVTKVGHADGIASSRPEEDGRSRGLSQVDVAVWG